jgi:hypothetical protein
MIFNEDSDKESDGVLSESEWGFNEISPVFLLFSSAIADAFSSGLLKEARRGFC